MPVGLKRWLSGLCACWTILRTPEGILELRQKAGEVTHVPACNLSARARGFWECSGQPLQLKSEAVSFGFT